MSLRSPPPPPPSLSGGNNPCLCEHLQARPALPSLRPRSLRPGSFRPPENANCQRRCFTGRGLRLSLFLRCQVTLTLLKTHWPHTAGSKSENKHTSESESLCELCSGSVWAKDSFGPFLWLLIRTTGMKNFPYLRVTDKLFAFGKYFPDWALGEPFRSAAVFAFWLLH